MSLSFCPDKSKDLVFYTYSLYPMPSTPVSNLPIPIQQTCEIAPSLAGRVTQKRSKKQELDERKEQLIDFYHRGLSNKQIAKHIAQAGFKVSPNIIGNWLQANIPFYKSNRVQLPNSSLNANNAPASSAISKSNSVATRVNIRTSKSQPQVPDAYTTTTSTTSTAPADDDAMSQIQSTPVVLDQDKLLIAYSSRKCRKEIYDNIHLIVQKLNEGATWIHISECLLAIGIKAQPKLLIEMTAKVTNYKRYRANGKDCDMGDTCVHYSKTLQNILDKKPISSDSYYTFLRIIMIEYKKCNLITYDILGAKGVKGPSYKATLSQLKDLYKQYREFSGTVYDFAIQVSPAILKAIVDKAREHQQNIS